MPERSAEARVEFSELCQIRSGLGYGQDTVEKSGKAVRGRSAGESAALSMGASLSGKKAARPCPFVLSVNRRREAWEPR